MLGNFACLFIICSFSECVLVTRSFLWLITVNQFEWIASLQWYNVILQTVCNDHQQMTKAPASKKRVKMCMPSKSVRLQVHCFIKVSLQTVCKDHQQMTKVVVSKKRVRILTKEWVWGGDGTINRALHAPIISLYRTIIPEQITASYSLLFTS